MEANVTVNMAMDGRTFAVPRNAIAMMETLSVAYELNDDHDAIVVPNVSGATMEYVIKYCSYHSSESTAEDAAKWDLDFANDIIGSSAILVDIIKAADYLNIKSLFDFSCKIMAEQIKARTVPEIRSYLNVVNDFSPEEYVEMKREFSGWAGLEENDVDDPPSFSLVGPSGA